MMQPTINGPGSASRIYSNINTAAMAGSYSPTAGYRTRLPTGGSIFSSFDDPFLQQARAAQAALGLAEMDVKNSVCNTMSAQAASMLRSSEMFSAGFKQHGLQNKLLNALNTRSNETRVKRKGHRGERVTYKKGASSYHNGLGVPTSGHHLDFDHHMTSIVPSSSGMIDPNSIVHQATADMASLQQVMAMHHYPSPHFTAQYQGMPQAFAVQTSSFPTSSITAAAVAASSACLPNCTVQLPNPVSRYPLISGHHAADIDTDPRELERFAEHFKQRRIKLGVTQADVGKALAHLKMPGVGSLSQSTICRFESLTLSHNNMVALKPILHSWLEKAEDVIKNKNPNEETHGILPNTEKKRKRTSIAAPEKRLLEDYFRQQPRPTGDRISAIAEKLDLKKNVVRVWFCNQRQKQKRSQFRSTNQTSRGSNHTNGNSSSHNQQEGRHMTDSNSPTDSDHTMDKCLPPQQQQHAQQQQSFVELNVETLETLEAKANSIGIFYHCNNQN